MLELAELTGVLALLVFGLVGFSFLMGQRVIEGRDRQEPAGDERESRPSDIACCGFGLPPIEKRSPDEAGSVLLLGDGFGGPTSGEKSEQDEATLITTLPFEGRQH